MSKVLITGAAGFIGSQLAYKFSEQDDLVLVDNFSYGHMDNLRFPDKSFENDVLNIDIRDAEAMEKLFKEHRFDYVYNIAGIAPLPDCQSDPYEAESVNVGGFVSVLNLARKYKVKKVIQASTNAIYENVETFPVYESQKYFDTTLIYPTTKYCAELFARSFCDSYLNMNVTCMRFANVYGPHIDVFRKQPPFVAYMMKEIFYGRVPVFHSDGEQKRDYIFIDDLAELAKLVRQGEGFDVVNCSSNKCYSVNELFSITKNLMGKSSATCSYASNDHYWEKYDLEDIKPEILHKEINKFTLCDNSYAKSKYGWEPKFSIDDGLKIMADYVCKILSEKKEK